MHLTLRRSCRRLLLFILLLPLLGGAQAPADKPAAPLKLSVENMMRGADLVGTEPRASPVGDGSRLYFRWKKPAEKTAELYVLAKPDWAPKKTTAEEMAKLPPAAEGGRISGGLGTTRFDRKRSAAW